MSYTAYESEAEYDAAMQDQAMAEAEGEALAQEIDQLAMKNPECPKCGEMMAKYWEGIVTKYKCRHCESLKDKE